MAIISEFYGITIKMEPQKNYLPHVFGDFGSYRAMFSAQSGEIMEGDFPHNENQLVTAWVLLHTKEIQENWDNFLSKKDFKLKPIQALE